MSILAAVESELSSYMADFVKQIPWATPLLLWILDLRRRNQVLEDKIQASNDKLQNDVIPLLTRLADVIPVLLTKLK